MRLFSRLLSGDRVQTVKTTADRPYRISHPTIGFLNLLDASGMNLAQSDRSLLGPLFGRVCESASEIPRCEVLFIYCTLHTDGTVDGSPEPLREMIKKAGAYVAVIASENPPEVYIKGMGPKRDWFANIVMTIDRKADKFAEFYARLFGSMFKGQSMLLAWVEMAPQIPGREHPDAPSAIMAAEAGHITFER